MRVSEFFGERLALQLPRWFTRIGTGRPFDQILNDDSSRLLKTGFVSSPIRLRDARQKEEEEKMLKKGFPPRDFSFFCYSCLNQKLAQRVTFCRSEAKFQNGYYLRVNCSINIVLVFS